MDDEAAVRIDGRNVLDAAEVSWELVCRERHTRDRHHAIATSGGPALRKLIGGPEVELTQEGDGAGVGVDIPDHTSIRTGTSDGGSPC